MTIHCCLLDKECREMASLGKKYFNSTYSGLFRIHLNTKKNFYTLALTPNARITRQGKLVWFHKKRWN